MTHRRKTIEPTKKQRLSNKETWMSERKAKALRKKIYGDVSQRIPKQYIKMSNGSIVNHPASLRAKYQQEKRNIKLTDKRRNDSNTI